MKRSLITLGGPGKSFYLSAGPVFYRVCSKIETFARPSNCVANVGNDNEAQSRLPLCPVS